MTALEARLKEIEEIYSGSGVPQSLIFLYKDYGQIRDVLAIFHHELNFHFSLIAERSKTNSHYWAENSRNLIELHNNVNGFMRYINKNSDILTLRHDYQKALENTTYWVMPSGGSNIPDSYEPFDIEKYEPIFIQEAHKYIKIKNGSLNTKLQHRGSGSYADVYSFKDPDYGLQIALKRLKKGATDSEKERFRQEFRYMRKISSPFVLQVYKYSEDKKQYTMEYCDHTLLNYISKRRGNQIPFAYRKRIAQNFLYGMQAIHSASILHRDISPNNVLIQEFDNDVVTVKISDFGLAKHEEIALTETGSSLKGTILDPTLNSFKDYDFKSEIYSIGWVLSFIFTGKKSYPSGESWLDPILFGCYNSEREKRYTKLTDLIEKVKNLEKDVA